MPEKILKLTDTFWNIRGSFRIGGLLDIGTQCSLVRLRAGGYVLLDSYTLSEATLDEVRGVTDGGRDVTAILNLHPFHTLHVRKAHAQFPNARLYGTSRHRRVAPELPWAPELTEDESFHALYADDFDFSVPRGVAFVPSNENLHFSSVLAFHRESRTLHVDDTLNWAPFPFGGVGLHPTLSYVLDPRPGAAAELRAWGEGLAARCADVDHLCTAHFGAAPALDGSLGAKVGAALRGVERTLAAHAKKYG